MMSAEVLQIVRLAWFLALGATLSAFRDAFHLTRAKAGARYLHTATRARVILGVIEGLLVVAAVTTTMLLHGADAVTALLGGRGPLDLPWTAGLPGALPAGLPAGSPAGLPDAPRDAGPVDSSALAFALAVLGVVLAWTGAMLASAAKRALGALFTANLGVKENHALVTTGPYALVRHPIYLGILLFTLGTGLVFDRGTVVLLTLALVPCFLVQARIEDRIFAAHFGAEHAAYRAQVPAVLPWPRPR
jgi:protein-S-isoprenylcysteine O-methyltransferase Ste14